MLWICLLVPSCISLELVGTWEQLVTISSEWAKLNVLQVEPLSWLFNADKLQYSTLSKNLTMLPHTFTHLEPKSCPWLGNKFPCGKELKEEGRGTGKRQQQNSPMPF
ncbi:hypothetical protein GUJ93_ZPchr0009g893 [Zizania palustris]|uniref:Uncharacterized protein n=1 Tax=Zizania palustris TaxID=103762 RepID=A0A8J5VMH5_ZIZPA|nr:hypothetical protein GUJ93_ZPchr0009g893 [Zizania palustris]